uniref:Xylanase inhibitor C-terminal domain-containing protein n=1 Tax=Triticum urartu TaxID=4572 RepID=A0A8R7V6I1_TRIUA
MRRGPVRQEAALRPVPVVFPRPDPVRLEKMPAERLLRTQLHGDPDKEGRRRAQRHLRHRHAHGLAVRRRGRFQVRLLGDARRQHGGQLVGSPRPQPGPPLAGVAGRSVAGHGRLLLLPALGLPLLGGLPLLRATRPNIVSYATLKSKASRPNLYFLRLVGVSVGRVDIPVPPHALAGDALMELHTTFTYLQPKVYAALRDQFRGWMGQYPVAPPYGELDTCYNFTGQSSVGVPAVELTFEGGAGLEPGVQQTMYFKDRGNIFSVGCLAFAPVPAHARGITVIGTLAQATTEVAYDLRGGKVGFVPKSC